MSVLHGRGEKSSDVCWGGNPDEPKLKINGILCPRQSFESYIQKACVESKKWTKEDINVISILRDRLCEHCHDWNMTLLEDDIELSNQKYMAAVQRAQDNYEFFAHMSHELRTPFHGVMGCLSLLCESLNNELNPDSMDLLHTALASGNHMLNLLNDILKISKSNHLSHDVSQENLSFQKMAIQLVNTMKPFAMTRGINITSAILPGNSDSVIVVDTTKVTQIVSNCVNNAIKFAPYGSTIDMQITLSYSICDSMREWRKNALLHAGHVFFPFDGNVLYDSNTIDSWLKRESSDPKDLWLMILISDSGCGMKSVELSAMFAPYTQSSCGSNRNFQGTGLGLYICVSLCHLLHGFIACASTPNKGTAFAIGIPVKQEELHNGIQTPKLAENKEIENVYPIPMTGGILIVDDNKVNVKILKRNIENECKKSGKSFDIFCAFGGEEAVEIYKIHQPSMCFIDYHMPDVDGILATKQIRAFEADQQLPPSYIMSYTADATLAARDIVLASGANDIMTKPPPKGMIPNLISRLNKVI
jgi:two-component system, chemotaxis family, sensor kinase Cph1